MITRSFGLRPVFTNRSALSFTGFNWAGSRCRSSKHRARKRAGDWAEAVASVDAPVREFDFERRRTLMVCFFPLSSISKSSFDQTGDCQEMFVADNYRNLYHANLGANRRGVGNRVRTDFVWRNRLGQQNAEPCYDEVHA